MDDLTKEFKELTESLEELPRDELIMRVSRAANSLMMAEVMVQNKIGLNLVSLLGVIKSVKNDLYGVRGERF